MTSTQSIVNKETTIRFSVSRMMAKISHLIVLVMSFLQERYNQQPIVPDWAKQLINSDGYAYPQYNP